MISRQTVDLDQRAGHAVGEVVEGVPRVGPEVVANVRRGVEPGAGEADPVEEGGRDPVLPPAGRAGLAVWGQPVDDDGARLQDGHPVQVGPGAGGGRRGVGDLVGACLGDVDLAVVYSWMKGLLVQFVGLYLSFMEG